MPLYHPEKNHLRALIFVCNQGQFFFITEQTSHLQASDETTGLLIWHLMCQQVANESQSPGWQLHQHDHPLWKNDHLWFRLPEPLLLTCAVCGVAKTGWLLMGGFLMTAAPLKRCGSKLCLNYLFYHYPAILIPLFSLPTGFCSDEKRACPTGRLKPVWVACFLSVHVCVCLNECRCAFALRMFPFITELWLSGYCCRHKLSQRTLIGLSGARWAWGRWGGNELKLTCQASIALM